MENTDLWKALFLLLLCYRFVPMNTLKEMKWFNYDYFKESLDKHLAVLARNYPMWET